LISTIGGWAILEWLAEIKTDDFRKSTFHNGSIWGFIFGLLAFFVGVVATAFLYSTMAGIIAIALSCYVVFFFFKTARDVSIAKKGAEK
jgi:cation transporter-like permease